MKTFIKTLLVAVTILFSVFATAKRKRRLSTVWSRIQDPVT